MLTCTGGRWGRGQKVRNPLAGRAGDARRRHFQPNALGDDLTDAKHWNTYWSNYEKNKNTSNRRF